MKTLLAALALLTGSALACTTASTVIAEGSCSTCAIQQPDQPAIPQTPEDSCNNCAIPTPPAQKLAENCSSCAVDQPSDAIPSEPNDNCSTCGTTTPPSQQLAESCSNCAVDQPSDEPIIRQEPADCGSASCLTPRPAPQRADVMPIVVAERSGTGC